MLKVIGWTDYDNNDFDDSDLTDEVYEVVAQAVKDGGYLFGGDSHQDRSGCCPLLSDGTKACFSWRGWGVVIAIAYDLKGNDGRYDYMCGYMDMMIKPEAIKRPGEYVDCSLIERTEPAQTFELTYPISRDLTSSGRYFAFPLTDELKKVKKFDFLKISDLHEEYGGYSNSFLVLKFYTGNTFEEALEEAVQYDWCVEEFLYESYELRGMTLAERFYQDYPKETVTQGVIIFKTDW